VSVGVHEKVPFWKLPPVVNVLPVVGGEDVAVNEAFPLPSGSFAVTPKLRRLPSVTVCVAGATTTGGRSTLLTVIAVAAVPVRAFDAVKVTV
jgi:hypothetical protein